MNDFNRNTRTLIVSFVIAIFALIPLRFIEVGEQQNALNQSQVLGETTVVEEIIVSDDSSSEEVVLGLEAPYDELERIDVVDEN